MLRTGSGQTEGTHSEKENAIAGAGPTEHAEEALEIVVATMAAPMPQLEVRDIHAPFLFFPSSPQRSSRYKTKHGD
jgi:hypothetical protein